jgi:hypothetical protein
MDKIVLQTVKKLLCRTFGNLRADYEIYLTPALIVGGRVGNFEIQIWDSGSGFSDPDGGILTETLQIGVGLILQSELNWSDRHGETLEKLHNNIFDATLTIKNLLENNILLDEETQVNTLTRPLRVTQITPIRPLTTQPLVLVRELGFMGGYLSVRTA